MQAMKGPPARRTFESEGNTMTPTTTSNDRYLKEQIDIMTGLLAQMVDHYAIARIRIQLWRLETELHNHPSHPVN